MTKKRAKPKRRKKPAPKPPTMTQSSKISWSIYAGQIVFQLLDMIYPSPETNEEKEV